MLVPKPYGLIRVSAVPSTSWSLRSECLPPWTGRTRLACPLRPVTRVGRLSCQAAAGRAEFDVVAVSNICVDVVLEVDHLPPLETIDRKKLLADETAALSQSADKSSWEVGGSCNVAIAAARLGLSVATCGNIPSDIYGEFLKDTLQVPPIPSSVCPQPFCILGHVQYHLGSMTARALSMWTRLIFDKS